MFKDVIIKATEVGTASQLRKVEIYPDMRLYFQVFSLTELALNFIEDASNWIIKTS